MSAKEAGKPDGKKLTLEQLRKKIRARYARPVVAYEDDVNQIPVYKSRFPKVNALLGGGVQAGAILEIFGSEDSGKSSFSHALAADIQRQAPKGKRHVILLNYERRQHWSWWRQLGLDTSKENFTQFLPLSLEEGIGNMVSLVETGEVCVVIIDSVFAGGSREGREAVKQWADPKAKKASLGIEARKWGETWTAVSPLLQETNTVCIAVNQVREKIELGGFGHKPGMPKPEETPRGRALKFFAWFRLAMRASNLDPARWGDKDVDGRAVRMKVIKNGINEAPRGFVKLDLIRGEGFDMTGDLIDAGLECGVIVGKGAGGFEINGKTIRGYDKFRATIAASEPLRKYLETEVEKHLAKPADTEKSVDSEALLSNDGAEAEEGTQEDTEES